MVSPAHSPSPTHTAPTSPHCAAVLPAAHTYAVMRAWVRIPALSSAGSVTMGRLQSIPELQFLLHLWNVDGHATFYGYCENWHGMKHARLQSGISQPASAICGRLFCEMLTASNNNGNSSHLLSPYLVPETALSTWHVLACLFLFL